MSRASGLMAHARTLQNRMWGESVTYVRQSTAAELTLTARKAGVRTANADTAEVVIAAELMDWIVTAADLVAAGATFEPDERDRIELVKADGTTETYLVGNYGGQCWEPADSEKAEYIVHTKLWSET